MRSASLQCLSLVLCSLAFFACHTSSTPAAPPLQSAAALAPKIAVTQVVQTFNTPYERAWPALLDALRSHNLSIKFSEESKGEILTDWVPIQDQLCGAVPRTGAMLSCRVRFLVRLQRLSGRASQFSISYYEECFDVKTMNIECPGSNAERMLKEIAEHLSSTVGA